MCVFQIISNNADQFLEQIPSASTPDIKPSQATQTIPFLPSQSDPSQTPPPPSLNNHHPLTCKNSSYLSPSEMKVLNLNDNENDEPTNKIGDATINRAPIDERQISQYSLNVTSTSKLNEDLETIVVTPKRHKRFNKENNCDGIVLTQNEENEFLEPSNLSPILQNNQLAGNDCLHNIQEEEEDGDAVADSNFVDTTLDAFMSKRKRDSFDNISMISTDSIAPVFNSAKKPKLIRTGSITRTLRRSMSFVATKNPISNMIRSRRNSVDPNASITSITSIESTFNESIKKPVKEKFRNLKARMRIGGKSGKGEFCLTPKTPVAGRKQINGDPQSPEQRNDDHVDASFVVDPFKTPLAPPRTSSLLSATKSHSHFTATDGGDTVCGTLIPRPSMFNSSATIDCKESTQPRMDRENHNHSDNDGPATAVEQQPPIHNHDIQSANVHHQMAVLNHFFFFFHFFFSLFDFNSFVCLMNHFLASIF